MLLSRSSKYVASILILLSFAGIASAAIVAPPAPDFHMIMQVGATASYPLLGTVTPIPDGDKWKYQIDGTYNQHGYEMTLQFVIEPDPSVFGNVTIRNTLATTQDYTFTFTLPVAPAFSPSLLNGSVGLTATADATPAIVASTAPDPIYSALIDGSTVKKLLDHPFALSAPSFDSAVTTDRFGLPIPVAGGAVTTDIGIKLHFNVTPGDQAAITSQFTANPVPEPSSLLSLALGSLALLHRSRRK
ncbi:MAG TPA: PEP-CTERM sorting domain-containing protein [Tepidisphaeraceae bacterium]|jgi:hypothetical protein|nr:PEP-CTERM sorting domain-containing protein [Tepidisphaeraceae bacterium]